jgi:hypothetical protein
MLLPLGNLCGDTGLVWGKVGTVPKEFHIVFYVAHMHSKQMKGWAIHATYSSSCQQRMTHDATMFDFLGHIPKQASAFFLC